MQTNMASSLDNSKTPQQSAASAVTPAIGSVDDTGQADSHYDGEPEQTSQERNQAPLAPNKDFPFTSEVRAALNQVIPKIPNALEAYIHRVAIDTKQSWWQAHIETIARYVMTAGVVAVIAYLAANKTISGEAVTGILGGLVGYLWGKSRKEDTE